MDKDKILEMSRKSGLDERELLVRTHAGRLAMAVGGLVCVILALLELIFTDKINPIVWVVYCSMLCVSDVYQFVKLRGKYHLIMSLIEFAFAVAFLVVYIIRLVG